MKKPYHKLHDGELPSDVSLLRGIISSNINRDVPGFLIQDHPNLPAVIIIQISTGKTVTIGLCHLPGVIQTIKTFNT